MDLLHTTQSSDLSDDKLGEAAKHKHAFRPSKVHSPDTNSNSGDNFDTAYGSNTNSRRRLTKMKIRDDNDDAVLIDDNSSSDSRK
mmetsp:Transcript_11140/g.14998  ORF Transcript_11140/g.14998 Transcript_11140/m.14998 type:complete len:85 (-) Transcript_11140:1397-1651(-)